MDTGAGDASAQRVEKEGEVSPLPGVAGDQVCAQLPSPACMHNYQDFFTVT